MHRPCALRLTGLRHKANFASMNDETPDSLIPYDEIVQEALRAVVGRVLGQIVGTGGHLPGSHHFYIPFKTGAPGVWRTWLICRVTADLNARTMVGIDPATGLPNCSCVVVGARRAVPLRSSIIHIIA